MKKIYTIHSISQIFFAKPLPGSVIIGLNIKVTIQHHYYDFDIKKMAKILLIHSIISLLKKILVIMPGSPKN